jgi:hypothetical protein
MVFGSPSESERLILMGPLQRLPESPHDTRTREELLDMVDSVTHDNIRLNNLLDKETERANRLNLDAKAATRAYTLACLTVTHLAKLARGEHSIHRSRPARRVRHPKEA